MAGKNVPVSPLAPKKTPKMPVIDGVAFATAEAGIRYKGRTDVMLALLDKGTQVAILARMGRPLSEMPPGMHFTHVAFIVYAQIQTADGRTLPGYAIHNLYQYDDQLNKSRLVQDFPVDFFSGVAQMEAGILIPSAQLQQQLLDAFDIQTLGVVRGVGLARFGREVQAQRDWLAAAQHVHQPVVLVHREPVLGDERRRDDRIAGAGSGAHEPGSPLRRSRRKPPIADSFTLPMSWPSSGLPESRMPVAPRSVMRWMMGSYAARLAPPVRPR